MKNMVRGVPRLAVVVLALVSSLVLADEPAVRVVVSEKSKVTALSRARVAAFFLKKTTAFDDGTPVEPVDQVEASPARKAFSDDVLRKSVRGVKSYWQQRIFQGLAVPPPEKTSDDEVMKAVAANPRAIGYVSGTAKLVGVREVTLTE